MSVYDSNTGTRLTKASLPKTAVTQTDPEFTIDVDVVEGFDFEGVNTSQVNLGRRKLFTAGQKVRQSQIDAVFPPAEIGALTPATGPLAGGTVVRMSGAYLDGVTAVTVGGTAVTALSFIEATRQLQFTTPAKSAGAYSVAITDDSGTFSKPNAFTYA